MLVIKKFDELTVVELHDILQGRNAVFVCEQSCAYQDIDGLDIGSHHLMITDNISGKLMAYCRVVPPVAKLPCPDSNNGNAVDVIKKNMMPSIGRVLVVKPYRKQGWATKLMNAAITFSQQTYPNHSIVISAQTYLVAFYESLGFNVNSKPYLEDGIEHIDMRLDC